jgi:hypothetical protein
MLHFDSSYYLGESPKVVGRSPPRDRPELAATTALTVLAHGTRAIQEQAREFQP